MRNTVIGRLVLAAVVLVPSVAAAQWGAPTTASPGPSFVWAGQWVPCSHPIAVQAGLGCVSNTPVPDVPPAIDTTEPPPPPAADV